MKADLRAALQSHPILAGVEPACVDAVLAAGVVRRFPRGAFLSREGDRARDYWLLLQGSVRVFYTSPDGDEVTVKLFGAPAAWAEMQVLHDYVHTEDCVAVEPATTLCLPKIELERVLDAHPRFMKNVLLDTGARFLIAAQNERALAFLSVPQRLALLVLSYVRLYGVPVEGGVLIRARLSQDELANGLGAARKSVVRAFREWREAGLVEKRGALYVVRDVERLAELAPKDLLGVDWVAGRRLADGLGPPAGPGVKRGVDTA